MTNAQNYTSMDQLASSQNELALGEIYLERHNTFFELHAKLGRALGDLDTAIKELREFEVNRFF